MVTRPATASDLPAIFALFVEMHGKSKYAEDVGLHEPTVRSTIMQAVQRHGGQNNGSTCFYVYEKDGEVVGFIIGILQRVYMIGDRLEAFDLFIYANDDAPARAASDLIGHYLEWAENCPKVAAIKLSWTDTISQDAERIGALYERKGLKRVGAIYERVMPV